MARPARSGPGRDAGRWTGRGARRLAQALFRVAAFVGPARGQRIGRLDVLRKIDLLPVEPLDRRGADAIALGDDVYRSQIPALAAVRGSHSSVALLAKGPQAV